MYRNKYLLMHSMILIKYLLFDRPLTSTKSYANIVSNIDRFLLSYLKNIHTLIKYIENEDKTKNLMWNYIGNRNF